MSPRATGARESAAGVAVPGPEAGALAEVPLPAGSVVITDLHLDVEDAAGLGPFLGWLARLGDVPRLLILGDLFEFWIGDAQLALPGAARVAEALAERVEAGTPVELVPGNRDFLLGPAFERASGCRLHPGGLVGLLPGGERVLFLHGDELALDDRGHVRLHRVLRSRALRRAAPYVPRPVAFALARRLRGASRSAKESKAPLSMELKPAACSELAARHRSGTVVCGHAHRFQDRRLEDGTRFLILDAFDGPRGTLRVGPAGALEAGRL